MKRLLLLTMMCLFGMFSVNAQETVTIGTKSTVAHQFPFHTWWQYSFSQQIYTSAEINHGASNIQKIKFFTDGTNYSRNIKVYMQNVDKKWFDSNTDWVDVTDADIVFDGTITTSTEIEITLDKPFAYAGGNLLLAIHDITNVDSGSSTKFDAYEDNSTRTICMFDEANSSLPGTGNATGFGEQHCLGQKTVLQITFEGGGENPDDGDENEETTLAAPVVTATPSNDSTIVLTWETVEGATKYYIYENDEVIGDVTTLFCELRGLEANTNYCFTVTAANDTMESEMSEPACATTLDVALPDEPGDGEETGVPAAPVATVTVSYDTIQIRWEPVEGATSYRLYYNNKVQDEFEDASVDVQVPTVGKYCFTITAVNAFGESEHSNEICADVVAPEGMKKPEAPELNTILEDNVVVLSWNAVEFGTYYNVFLETPQSAEPYQYLGTSKDTSVRLELEAKGEYCFFVTAQNLVGESKKSNTSCVNYGEGVEEISTSFNIYPNPVNDKIYIETLTQTQTLTVEIYDIYGRNQNLSNLATQQLSNSIDVTNLNSGVYFVKVVTENGESVKRFIKK